MDRKRWDRCSNRYACVWVCVPEHEKRPRWEIDGWFAVVWAGISRHPKCGWRESPASSHCRWGLPDLGHIQRVEGQRPTLSFRYCCSGVRLEPNHISFVFEGLRRSRLELIQALTLSMHGDIRVARRLASRCAVCPLTCKSSAKACTLRPCCSTVPMTSAEYTIKRIGPSNDPWGTPEVTIVVTEVSPLKWTNCERPVR